MSKYFNLDVISLNECLVIPSLPIMNSPSTAPATVPFSSLVALALALALALVIPVTIAFAFAVVFAFAIAIAISFAFAIVIAFSFAVFNSFGLSFVLCLTILLTAHWVDTLVTFSRSVWFVLLVRIVLLIDSNPRQQEGLLTVEIIQSPFDRLHCQLLDQLVRNFQAFVIVMFARHHHWIFQPLVSIALVSSFSCPSIAIGFPIAFGFPIAVGFPIAFGFVSYIVLLFSLIFAFGSFLPLHAILFSSSIQFAAVSFADLLPPLFASLSLRGCHEADEEDDGQQDPDFGHSSTSAFGLPH